MFFALALISSFMWGVADFVGGLVSRKTATLIVVTLSQGVGMVTVFAYGWLSHAAWDWRALSWALLASLSGAVGLNAFYYALANGRMGIVSPIAAMGAAVPMFAGLLSGETPTSVQLIGMFVGVVGIVLASGPELNGGTGAKPVAMAAVAAAGFGVALFALARGSEFSVFTTTGVMRITTVLVMSVFVIFKGGFGQARGANWSLLVVAGVFDVAANITFGIASTQGMLAVVSILGSLYPVVTAVLAAWILKERLAQIQYLGAALTVIGVVAIAAG